MIRHELHEDDGILIVSPEAPLAAADFKSLAQEVDPYIEREGRLAGLLIEAAVFPGWQDFGALISHLRFVRDHHRKIRRIAMVSDSAVLTIAPRLAEHFVAAQVKHFTQRDRQAALDWLRGS
jgi:stage II sporulation SpoAA-like protein